MWIQHSFKMLIDIMEETNEAGHIFDGGAEMSLVRCVVGMWILWIVENK